MTIRKFDRMEVPEFFTPLAPDQKWHILAFGRVFAISDDHSDSRKGWVSVGYVSNQTPLGQGTYLGFHRSELRRATKEEVTAALNQNHAQHEDFRPGCLRTGEQAVAEHHELMLRWESICNDQTEMVLESFAEVP